MTIDEKGTVHHDLLGEPLHEERCCPDGVGRYRTYANGSIHCHPSHGAFETHGAIRQKWASLGWERGWLGYPVADEAPLSAAELQGLTQSPWGDFEDGIPPEYPPEQRDPSYGAISHFEHGAICWLRASNKTLLLRKTSRSFRGQPRFEPYEGRLIEWFLTKTRPPCTR